MIVSGYSMDLYCWVKGNQHDYKEGHACFVGETWAECAKQARFFGWKINKRQPECICPKCIAQGLKLTNNEVGR